MHAAREHKPLSGRTPSHHIATVVCDETTSRSRSKSDVDVYGVQRLRLVRFTQTRTLPSSRADTEISDRRRSTKKNLEINKCVVVLII